MSRYQIFPSGREIYHKKGERIGHSWTHPANFSLLFPRR
ncbi:Uncharacterized protein dnm_050460 [Desulfonema magnum]|uniref:Uncharacterized protein n=1 Tax=Desulfonema magnum TaxID=45655 RepID=A0A975BP11_9BACT|nr:Uncharacterized protein dnm_050460 [Desulfonema magnum]